MSWAIRMSINVQQYQKVLLRIFFISVALNFISLYAVKFLIVTIGDVINAYLTGLFQYLSFLPNINTINSCLTKTQFSEMQEAAVRLPIVFLSLTCISELAYLLLFLFAQRKFISVRKTVRTSPFNLDDVSVTVANLMTLALPAGSFLLLLDNFYPIMSGWQGLSSATACLPRGGGARFAINNTFAIGLIIGWVLFISRTKRR